MRTPTEARKLGLEALDRRTRSIEPDEPFAGVILRARRAAGLTANPSRLFQHWSSQSIGSEVSPLRFPWVLTHERYVKIPEYAGPTEDWKAWHASESEELKGRPFRLEAKLSTPLILSHNCELLLETVEAAPFAGTLLQTVLPRARRDFASFVQATDPWADTFALWCLVSQPLLFQRLRPIALAIAVSYAETALAKTGGAIQGTRFPFRDKDLCSASAYLAVALLALGTDLQLVSRLVAFLQGAQREDGGWGDGADPSDPLTTLAVAQLLASIVPDFDVGPANSFLLARQEEAGWWRALGPERPWLTQQVLGFLGSAGLPFEQRFRWPPCEPSEIDPKTGLPRYAYFVSLGDLFSSLPGLAVSDIELGFLDLAGFKKFNDTFGQDRGDQVLRLLATHLSGNEGVRPVRDGGDEYLLLGAPTATGLESRLDALRRDWPRVFRQEFGEQTPVVSPRILVTRVKGGELLAAREALGKGITSLKGVVPGPEGVMEVI